MFYSQVNFQRPVEDHTVSMEDPEKNLLQLGKGGWMTPPGGLRPPDPPLFSLYFLVYFA